MLSPLLFKSAGLAVESQSGAPLEFHFTKVATDWNSLRAIKLLADFGHPCAKSTGKEKVLETSEEMLTRCRKQS